MSIDRAAIEEVYRRRYGAFRNALAGILGSYDLAHDVVQESFTQALKHASAYRGEGTIEAWIWTIAIRLAARERSGRRTIPIDEIFDARLPEPPRDEELAQAIRALPSRQRLVVFLRYVADLPYEDISRVCEISEGTVAATLSHAKTELARRLRIARATHANERKVVEL